MRTSREAWCAGWALALLMGISSLHAAEIRNWTATDGRTLEAEMVSATERNVTLRRKADGRRFTLPLDKLSDADREYVAEALEDLRGPEPKEASGIFADKLTGEWERMEFASLKFRFFGGRSIKANKRYPVVLYLHGRGSGGTDNEKPLRTSPRRFADDAFYRDNPSLILIPQCPDDSRGWRGEYLDDVIGLVREAIEHLPVDVDRIYITGVSMGGFGTWSALAHSPDLFAAAVPVCGGGNPGAARKIKDIPIWNHHGAADDVVGVENSRRIVEALERAKGQIKYTEYDEASGIKHDAWAPCYGNDEVYEWLFAQRRGERMVEP